MKPCLLKILGALAGLAAVGSLYYPNLDQFFGRQNDFMPLYVAAGLAGSGELYDPAPYEAFETEKFGFTTQIHYNRLPFYAALLRPLASFDYWPAYGIFTLARFAALLGFLALWTVPRRSTAILWACWSFPLFGMFLGGQDVIFPLLGMALAVQLHERGRGLAAGLAMTLFAVKFHLFVLTPLACLQRDRREVLYGFSIGVAALLVANAWVGGWDWPLKFLDAALLDTHEVQADTMPNLHGLLAGLPVAVWLEAAASTAVVVMTWLAARQASFAAVLALSVWGSLLISHHAYVADTLVLLPAALAVGARIESDWAKYGSLLILAPPLSIALLSGRPASLAMQAMILAYFTAASVVLARRATQPSQAADQTGA